MDYTARDYIEFAEQQVGNATPAATGMLYVALAQAVALVSIAESLADIANAMRDDGGNSVAHILHNMSFNLDVIASCVASNEARDEAAAI